VGKTGGIGQGDAEPRWKRADVSWRVRAGAGSDELRDSGGEIVGNTGSGGVGEGEADPNGAAHLRHADGAQRRLSTSELCVRRADSPLPSGRAGGQEGGGLAGRTGGREAKEGGKVGFCVSWGGQLETVRIARDATLSQAPPLTTYWSEST